MVGQLLYKQFVYQYFSKVASFFYPPSLQEKNKERSAIVVIFEFLFLSFFKLLEPYLYINEQDSKNRLRRFFPSSLSSVKG